MTCFVCTRCGQTAPLETRAYCCSCGGLFELSFTPRRFSLELVDRHQFNIFRYRAFMPLDNDVWRDVTLGEGLTDTVQIEPNIYVKTDFAMPTLSFKDRGAAVLIWLCRSLGVQRVLQDSSGNAGNAVAAYCARAGIACEIYVPRDTSPKKIAAIKAHGATVVVYDGTRDETADACRARVAEEGVYYASHVYNPLFYQGTKTYLYEVFEQLGRIPDNIFIPAGNGTLLLGCQLALKDLADAGCVTRWPKLFIVQSERCAPLYYASANRGNAPVCTEARPTLAEGIAIARPMRAAEILSSSYAGEREIILAPEEGILPAQAILARKGFFVEHTSAATYAAYQARIRQNPLHGDVLIPLCGAGLKSEK